MAGNLFLHVCKKEDEAQKREDWSDNRHLSASPPLSSYLTVTPETREKFKRRRRRLCNEKRECRSPFNRREKWRMPVIRMLRRMSNKISLVDQIRWQGR